MAVTPISDLVGAFPALAQLGDADLREVLVNSSKIVLEPGTLVFEIGQACRQYLLIQSGRVRVHLLDQGGHEVVLYRIGRGDTCILTTAALLGDIPYSAYAVTETPVVASGVAADLFDRLVARSVSFRRFVFASHAARITELMRVISNVAFTRVQVRLARCLLDRMDASGVIALTHEEIAVELGTAREVVSRNLKLRERSGCVRPGQGQIIVLDVDRLRALSNGTGQ